MHKIYNQDRSNDQNIKIIQIKCNTIIGIIIKITDNFALALRSRNQSLTFSIFGLTIQHSPEFRVTGSRYTNIQIYIIL